MNGIAFSTISQPLMVEKTGKGIACRSYGSSFIILYYKILHSGVFHVTVRKQDLVSQSLLANFKILRVRPRDYQTVIHSLSTFKTEENSESESQSLRLHPENENESKRKENENSVP